MRVRVQYSTMIVRDLEESVRFYRDVLGMKEGYHVDLSGNAGITIMESEGGACVELIQNDAFDIGLYSVGTDVDDLDEAIRTLEEKGYHTTKVVPTSVGKMCFVQDPNGVRVCLIQHSEEYKREYME